MILGDLHPPPGGWNPRRKEEIQKTGETMRAFRKEEIARKGEVRCLLQVLAGTPLYPLVCTINFQTVYKLRRFLVEDAHWNDILMKVTIKNTYIQKYVKTLLF